MGLEQIVIFLDRLFEALDRRGGVAGGGEGLPLVQITPAGALLGLSRCCNHHGEQGENHKVGVSFQAGSGHYFCSWCFNFVRLLDERSNHRVVSPRSP